MVLLLIFNDISVEEILENGMYVSPDLNNKASAIKNGNDDVTMLVIFVMN